MIMTATIAQCSNKELEQVVKQATKQKHKTKAYM